MVDNMENYKFDLGAKGLNDWFAFYGLIAQFFFHRADAFIQITDFLCTNKVFPFRKLTI